MTPLASSFGREAKRIRRRAMRILIHDSYIVQFCSPSRRSSDARSGGKEVWRSPGFRGAGDARSSGEFGRSTDPGEGGGGELRRPDATDGNLSGRAQAPLRSGI